MKNFDLNAFNKRIKNLLIADPVRYKTILRYFENRKRSTQTDVNQLAVYIKAFAKEQNSQEITNDHIGIFLHILKDYGVGELVKENGKYKFKWDHWIFPQFDSHGRLIRIDTKDKEHLKESPGSQQSPADAQVDNSPQAIGTNKSINEATLEELILEISRRGFRVTLEAAK